MDHQPSILRAPSISIQTRLFTIIDMKDLHIRVNEGTRDAVDLIFDTNTANVYLQK